MMRCVTTMRVTQEIGRTLRAELAREGRNQTWLAAAIGRGQSYVSDVLVGRRALTIDELYLACDALGLSTLAVVRDAEHRARGKGSTNGSDNSGKGSATNTGG